jgi:hypothetical protein
MQRKNQKSLAFKKKKFFLCVGTPVPRGIFSRQTVTREVFNTSSQSSEWELDMLRANMSGPSDANTAWFQVLLIIPSLLVFSCMNGCGERAVCYQDYICKLAHVCKFYQFAEVGNVLHPLPPPPPPHASFTIFSSSN